MRAAMRRLRWVAMGLTTTLCLVGTAAAQTENGEWRSYSGDPGSTKYAPLDQINRTNVKNLRIAWRRPAVDPLLSGKDPKLQVPNNFRATPLMIGGVLYQPERRRSGRSVRSRHGQDDLDSGASTRSGGACAVPARAAWRIGATAATNASSCSGARC